MEAESGAARLEPRGEFVVVMGPRVESKPDDKGLPEFAADATQLFDYLTKYPSMDESAALAMVAARYKVEPNEVRKAIKKQRILVKQQKHASD